MLIPMSDRDPKSDQSRDRRRRATYDKVRHVVDEDSLHDLIASYGPEFLDREFPYIVVAARNRLRSRLRRIRPEESFVEDDLSYFDDSWDPVDQIEIRTSFRDFLDALALLDDRDVLVLWRQAEGISDEEVVKEWDLRGFEPPNPSRGAIRKRRERARLRLRTSIGQNAMDL